jgi:hypothetical protein
MHSYLDALLARGDFADYFTDDVTWTIIGTDQQVRGREPVRTSLRQPVPAAGAGHDP